MHFSCLLTPLALVKRTDQACLFKPTMDALILASFLCFYCPRLRLGLQNQEKELGQYPAILTSHLINNAYILALIQQTSHTFIIYAYKAIASYRISLSVTLKYTICL